MKHEVTVIARTFEVDETNNVGQMNNDLTVLSGKAAGVCYMPDDYAEKGIQDTEKAMNRALGTSKSGHHSVFEHGYISMILKTSKMMAIVLNSLGVYTTSEKSARYTKMQPETELELHMYNKWKARIQQLIIEKYPDMDDIELNKRFIKWFKEHEGEKQAPPCIYHNRFDVHTDVDKACQDKLEALKKSETLPSMKLAMENARYMISVFTPTTMMYTVSFRQLHLIVDYLYKLEVNCSKLTDNFSKKLLDDVNGLRLALEGQIGEKRLHDTKNQHIRLLEYQHKGDLVGREKKWVEVAENEQLREEMLSAGKREVLGDSYTLVYTGSLAMLAQAHRHRSLRYTMYMKEAGEFGYYVPPIVADRGLTDEWLSDISSLAYCIPQGTLVRITEQGIFEDFILKCKERLCGRAQLEIALSTKTSLEKFLTYKGMSNLCPANLSALKSLTFCSEDNTVLPKCTFKDFECTEGCRWGANGLKRLI